MLQRMSPLTIIYIYRQSISKIYITITTYTVEDVGPKVKYIIISLKTKHKFPKSKSGGTMINNRITVNMSRRRKADIVLLLGCTIFF